MPVIGKLCGYPLAGLLFTLGVGTAATTPVHELAAWIAAATSIVAAFLLLCRTIARVASDRQHIFDKLCAQADRLDRLLPVVTEACDSMQTRVDEARESTEEMMRVLHRRLDENDKLFHSLIEKVCEANGHCKGRRELYAKMAEHLAVAEGAGT